MRWLDGWNAAYSSVVAAVELELELELEFVDLPELEATEKGIRVSGQDTTRTVARAIVPAFLSWCCVDFVRRSAFGRLCDTRHIIILGFGLVLVTASSNR